MRLSVPGVRIAQVETCDFGLVPRHETETLLRLACPDTWQRYLESPIARRFLAELGVERRHVTQVPGLRPELGRLTAIDLARSAVERLRARAPLLLERLDALLFVSTSNPNPCNSQAAMLARQLGLEASCLDLKAGCSGGVMGVAQAALLVQAGCERVLVVIAENLSQLTPADDLRALLTVGDGAACLLVERSEGAGFLSVLHGTAPEFAGAMAVRTPFPPVEPGSRYVFEISDASRTREALRHRWRAMFLESIEAAAIHRADLARCFLHQTHRAQLDGLQSDLGLDSSQVPRVVHDHGNMGSPTFAVAMAREFARLAPGDRYLMAAVGGGLSWCAIVAEHA
jgi:3-oxoacyl-[acyl-carrier-protein] synthase-3